MSEVMKNEVKNEEVKNEVQAVENQAADQQSTESTEKKGFFTKIGETAAKVHNSKVARFVGKAALVAGGVAIGVVGSNMLSKKDSDQDDDSEAIDTTATDGPTEE